MAQQSGAQAPAALAGSKVVLLVSKGAPPDANAQYVTVPDVAGKAQGDALTKLQDAGLTARVFDEASESVSHEHVIAQTPQAGQSAVMGGEVVLLVSSGRPPKDSGYVVLPNVIGKSEADATARVTQAGLSPQSVHDFSPTVPSGTVIDQVPNPITAGEEPKRSLAWLWILLAVLVLAAVAVGGFMWFNRKAAVPNVIRMEQGAAESAITSAGFKVGSISTTQTASAEDVGKVVAQSPQGGTQARANSAIDLVISGGQKLVPVPDVSGMTQSEAQSALEKAQLKAVFNSGNSNTVPDGKVMSQAPAAGQQSPVGGAVTVTISHGPKFTTVPDVTGKSQPDATSALEKLGLKVNAVTNYNASVPSGDVYAQAPTAGTQVAPGTTVSLAVSKGAPPSPATVTVPNVIGQTQADATTALKGLGFKVVVSSIASGTAGQVVGQAPAANSKETQGSTVTILVSTGP